MLYYCFCYSSSLRTSTAPNIDSTITARQLVLLLLIENPSHLTSLLLDHGKMSGESNHAFKADGEIVSYPILIIGAGISGIAAGCQVKRTLGIKDFVIFDKNSGIGVSILLY